MKPICSECYWVWPFHAPWCSKDCRHETAVMALCLLAAPGCATVRTVADVGTDLCRVWMAQHPERTAGPEGVTCDAIEVARPFVDAIQLAAVKPQPQAITDALADHPPLSMALTMCVPPEPGE